MAWPDLRTLSRELRYRLSILRQSYGVFPRRCPCCQFEGHFRATGSPPRYDAVCPRCGSLERHRLTKLWLDRSSGAIPANAEILHFAPERPLIPIFRAASSRYETADLKPGNADCVLNIEAIDRPDASVDVVVCFHVLEHVDDAKALREIHRVLRPRGIALLMVPLVAAWSTTYEDSRIRSEKDRILHFGKDDHVRFYGADVRDRIRSAGFRLEELCATEPDVSTFSLLRGETLFIAHKD